MENSQTAPQDLSSQGGILIVDDTPENLRLLSQMLMEQGYLVRPVRSGALALEAVKAIPPDLILLDIKMPEMNGFEVCECLKAEPRTRDIPIIFISALDDIQDKVKAFNLGGVDYITKPFNFQEVLARVQTHLALQALYRQLAEKNLELEQQAEALARSNAELEQFAHVISHDLREPLRMVSSYLQLLEHGYAEQLDEQAKDFIAYAVDGADRMQAMIKSLLTYARVDTQGGPLKLVDCERVLAHTLMDLKITIEEAHASITHDTLPTVHADAVQLEHVFQNLISNAIKFRGETLPRIHIAAERQADTWCFSVSDNGIGIDPQYADEIFKVFRRLHTREEYPGLGIGLAFCKRIVERHGGRIWVESEPGQGATFFFTLPVEPSDFSLVQCAS